MMIPTIHSNGDTQETLYRQCSDALEAVRMAMATHREMYPNGRNYYPQGADALPNAIKEHLHQHGRLEDVMLELQAMLEAIADGGHKPG